MHSLERFALRCLYLVLLDFGRVPGDSPGQRELLPSSGWQIVELFRARSFADFKERNQMDGSPSHTATHSSSNRSADDGVPQDQRA